MSRVNVRAAARDECDLVMKGGITSGVAYPAAVLALSERYDFRSIGGASAGAIAAAVTAAAQHGRDSGGMERLRAVQGLFAQPGLLVQLFQPTREARPAFRFFLGWQAAGSRRAKLGVALRHIVGRLTLPILGGVSIIFAALATLFSWLTQPPDEGLGWEWVALGVLLLCSAVVALGVTVVARLIALVRKLPASYHGMCLGKAEGRSATPALTEWLHTQVQHIAGLPEHEPLTFAMLEAKDRPKPVHLRMMTTDLTAARPVRYPLPERHPYLFAAEEWRSFFPDTVIACLEGISPVVRPADDTVPALRRIPHDHLPVIVATRMSLSFPFLLSAVPVWQLDPHGHAVRHWMSDGGITSNFPIHFFDAWLPTRPTFGLNLIPRARAEAPTDLPAEGAVHPPGTPPPPPPPRVDIGTAGALGAQILDTMQNWRDTLQSELPGFSDRIAHIRLQPHEGGMNITMPVEAITNVTRKGDMAGRMLRDDFDFQAHWFKRYRGLMRELQTQLAGDPRKGAPSGVKAAFTRDLAEWLRSGQAEAQHGHGLSRRWYRLAVRATRRMLRAASRWLGRGETFQSDGTTSPGVMRMTPDI